MDSINNESKFDINKKTPEELLELLNAYQQAININIISSVTDTKGTILYANSKFCEVSKYSLKELVGQNHRIINSGFHPKTFFKKMWQTIGKGNAWHEEIKNKAKDGTFYWVDTVILPIRNKEGKIIQYLSLRTLITEKKEIEEERKEYTEKLREMLHMTSHRVRGPLTSCMGLLDLIENGKILSEEELIYVMQHLKSSALKLDEFTQELTLFMHNLEKKYNKKTDATKTETNDEY